MKENYIFIIVVQMQGKLLSRNFCSFPPFYIYQISRLLCDCYGFANVIFCLRSLAHKRSHINGYWMKECRFSVSKVTLDFLYRSSAMHGISIQLSSPLSGISHYKWHKKKKWSNTNKPPPLPKTNQNNYNHYALIWESVPIIP